MRIHEMNDYEMRSVERVRWLVENCCEGRAVDFVTRTGIPKSTVSMYMAGVHAPSSFNAGKIAQAFLVNLEWVQGYDVPMRREKPETERTLSIPIYKRIPFGVPLDQIVDIEGTEEVEKDRIPDKDVCFAFSIQDDSMQPRIRKDDVVIVCAKTPAKSNDLILAAVDGKDAVCRRLMVYSESFALFASDPEIPPQYFTDEDKDRVRILGKVTELRARL